MNEIDFYAIYSSEGEEKLKEKLLSLQEEMKKIPEPNFEEEDGSSEEDEDEDEEEGNWGNDDEVDLN